MAETEKEFSPVVSKTYFNITDKAYVSGRTKMYYRHAKGPTERMKALIGICVVAGLFHSGWEAIKLFMRVMQGLEDDIELVVVHGDHVLRTQGSCIAMGVVSKGHVQVFVRKNYRRLGIGSSVLRFLQEKGARIEYSMPGERGSMKFWNKNNVVVDN